MLTRRTEQTIRTLKSIGSFHAQIQLSAARDPQIETRHSPCRALKACSRRAVISRHTSVSPRFCSSVVTPIPAKFYRSGHARPRCKPVKAAQEACSRASRTTLFTSHVENQVYTRRSKLHRSLRFPPKQIRLVDAQITLEIGKAATLVMFQPSAPAREPITRMHAPVVRPNSGQLKINSLHNFLNPPICYDFSPCSVSSACG
jgi:hypothetical protein